MNHIFEHQELIKSQIAGTYLQKGAKVPVGTVSNGYKKVAEGKWQKVSEHGMTFSEHKKAKEESSTKASYSKRYVTPGGAHVDEGEAHRAEATKHAKALHELDDKEYGDAEAMGTETKFERGDEIVVGKFKMDVIGYEGGKLKVMNKQGEKFTLTPKQTEDAHKQLHPKEGKQSHPADAKLDKLLNKFSDNPSSWKEATGELADMHNTLAEYHNERGGNHEMRKEHSKTPADHNQYHKKNIKELFSKMTPSQKDDFYNHYSEWLNKGEDTDLGFMTPLEHQEILKSQIAGTFEKGGKAAVLGEKRTFGGKDYIKTSKGWRPVGKNSGKVKEAHDAIHGESMKLKENGDGTFSTDHKGSTYHSMPGEDKEAFKKRAAASIKADHSERGSKSSSFEQILADPKGKQYVEGIEGLDSKRADHKPLYKDYQKKLKEEFGYDYQDKSWSESESGEGDKAKLTVAEVKNKLIQAGFLKKFPFINTSDMNSLEFVGTKAQMSAVQKDLDSLGVSKYFDPAIKDDSAAPGTWMIDAMSARDQGLFAKPVSADKSGDKLKRDAEKKK